MEENKDYRAYRYGDHLEPGAELKIEHSVSCEDVDISSLITMGKAGSRHADDQPGAFLPANPGGDAYRK